MIRWANVAAAMVFATASSLALGAQSAPPAGCGAADFQKITQQYLDAIAKADGPQNPPAPSDCQGSVRQAVDTVNLAGNASATVKVAAQSTSFIKTPLGIATLGAAAATPLVFLGHGGGAGTTTGGGTTSGGATGGGGTGGGGGGSGGGTTFTATSLNGTLSGDVALQGGTSTVHANAACAGSTPAYGETAVVNLSATGAGTLTLTDNPNFPRTYNITVTALNQTIVSSGTFSFFGTPVPGTISIVFPATTQMTMTETNTFGSCSNTYSGTLKR